MKSKIKFKISSLFIIAFASLIILSSCKEEVTNPQEKAIIEISKPLANSIYILNDTIKISGMITGLSELHGYEITITNLKNDSILYSDDEHTHGTEFSIEKEWINTLDEDADLEINITAELDHDGNTLSKKVLIQTVKSILDSTQLEGGIGGTYSFAIFTKHNGEDIDSRVFIKYAADKAPSDTTGYDAKSSTMVETGYGPHVHFSSLKVGTYYVFASSKLGDTDLQGSKVVNIASSSPKGQDITLDLK